jgi:hypothetical protein
MPALIPYRGVLVLGLSLALLESCSIATGASSRNVAPMSVSQSKPDVNNPNTGERSGFRFSLGLGLGQADLTCNGCVFDSKTGYSAFLSVAHSIAPKTLLGVEATGWTKEISGSTVRIWGVMAQLTQYLSGNRGPFLSAGLGYTGFHVQDLQETSGNGLGFSGRLGYEIAMGPLAIVPYAAYLRGLGGGGVNQGDVHMSTKVNIHDVHFGVAITAP